MLNHYEHSVIDLPEWMVPDLGLDDEHEGGMTPRRSPDPIVQALMEVRHAIGLSQVGLAREMGISQRTLQDWELGRRQPKGPSKALLQRMLDVLVPPETVSK